MMKFCNFKKCKNKAIDVNKHCTEHTLLARQMRNKERRANGILCGNDNKKVGCAGPNRDYYAENGKEV